jgi:hypothetical protein
MPKLFSYVVQHDHGYAPNPKGGCCTLAKCKFGSIAKRNIVEMAEKDDWIVGTGGADLTKSAGPGKLIYAMRVDRKIPLGEFRRTMGNRIDAQRSIRERGRFALISRHFFYFGRNAIKIDTIPMRHLDHPFEKKGPAYRCDFTEAFIKDFVTWLHAKSKGVRRGPPCQPLEELGPSRLTPKVRRKPCPQP